MPTQDSSKGTCSLVPNIQVVALDITIESSRIVLIEKTDGASAIASHENVEQHAASHILNNIPMRCSFSQIRQHKGSLCVSLVLRFLDDRLFSIVAIAIAQELSWAFWHEGEFVVSMLMTVEVVVRFWHAAVLTVSSIAAVCIPVPTVQSRCCIVRRFLGGQGRFAVQLVAEWAAT